MPGIVLTQSLSDPVSNSHPTFRESHRKSDLMSWEDLIYLADLFLAGGERAITVLGSDPLDHPHFMDMVAYLLERGCLVSIRTSGRASEKVIADAVEMGNFLHKDLVNFYCDMTDLAQGASPDGITDTVSRFLATFNNRVSSWITITRPDFSLDPVVSLINTHNLRRVIRVSLGQPGESSDRPYLEPDQIEEAVSRLFTHADLLDTFRVKLNFDCGFLPCCFSDEQLAYLVKNVPGFSIRPCSPDVTVGPDMVMWSCRQLPAFSRKSILEFNSYNEIRQFYGEQHFAVRFESSGAFVHCDTCMMREDIICNGGCIAPILPRFAGEHPYSVAKNPLRRKEVFE